MMLELILYEGGDSKNCMNFHKVEYPDKVFLILEENEMYKGWKS